MEDLIARMHIKLSPKCLKKLKYKSIKDKSQISLFDFRRVFKYILMKPELALTFKKILNIPQNLEIRKQKASL